MVRYSNVFVYLLLSLIIFVLFCLSGSASESVDTEISLEFVDGVHLDVFFTIDVNEFTLPANGVSYTKAEIQDLSGSNPEMMGAIKISVKGVLLDQLYESFPGATIDSLQELPNYVGGVFTDECSLTLSSSFFSLNESVDIDALVNGYLDCGAYVNYSFTLHSYTGWNQSYMFTLPGSLSYKITNGDVHLNHITWTVSTLGEPAEKDAQLTLLESFPTSTYSENESMQVHFLINCSHPEKPLLTLQFLGYKTLIQGYNMLPEFLTHVKTIPADALRLSVSQNLTSWETVRNLTYTPTFLQVKSLLENSSFNQTISPVFSWENSTTFSVKEPYNLTQMDTNPPVTANYHDDSIRFTLCNISSYAFYGLINAGGRANISSTDVNLGDNLNGLSYPYYGTILLPEKVLMNNNPEIYWDENLPINGSFSSSDSPSYTDYNISTLYDIQVKNTDLNLLSFFTGKSELSMGLTLKETQSVHVTELPFHFHLPRQLILPFLNSDALRICIDEQVFTNQQIEEFISYQNVLFQSRSKTFFPLIKGKPVFDQSLFELSQLWDGNISSMDAKDPLILSSSMQTAYPLLFDFSILPPQVSIQPLNLSFTGINHQNVTYVMTFPKGIAIDVSDTLNRSIIQKLPDGRYAFSVWFNDEEGGAINTIFIRMHPSGLYILGMLVPCILSFIITVVLLFLVFYIRKKRKTMPPKSENQPQSDYEQEDYYVPPPPSKRR